MSQEPRPAGVPEDPCNCAHSRHGGHLLAANHFAHLRLGRFRVDGGVNYRNHIPFRAHIEDRVDGQRTVRGRWRSRFARRNLKPVFWIAMV